MKSFVLALLMAVSVSPALALDQKVLSSVEAVPQINNNCSASVIYSKRDEKSGEVETLLLTAKHCVKGNEANDQIIDFPRYANNRVIKKDSYIGSVIKTSYNRDLALLKVNDTKTLFDKVNKVCSNDLTVNLGDETIAIGYPFSMGINFTYGNFMSVIKVPGFQEGDFIRATPDVGPGNSGGALIHKEGNCLLGVTSGVIQGFPFTGLYVSREDINDFLKTVAPQSIGLGIPTSLKGGK